MNTAHAVKMGDRGRLVVPADLRQRQHWDQGTPLIFVETADGVLVATREQMKARVRKQLAGTSLVEELTRDRREQAAKEDAA